MLVNALGEDQFKTGIRSYLKQFAYGNTCTRDLWNVLSATSSTDVASLMHSWTAQTGYPLVRVSREGSTLVLSQFRHLSSGVNPEDTSTWTVPISILTSSEPKIVKVTLEGRETRVDLSHVLAPSDQFSHVWFKVNPAQTGFYRVQYSKALTQYVVLSLAHISAADRWGVVSDAFAMAIAGHTPTVFILQLLVTITTQTTHTPETIPTATMTANPDNDHERSNWSSQQQQNYREREFNVWNEVIMNVKRMRSVWSDEAPDVQSALGTFFLNAIGPVAKEIGWQQSDQNDHTESHSTRLLRPEILAIAGQLGDPEILEEARRMFSKYADGNTDAIHPDLLGPVVCCVVSHGNTTTLNQVFNICSALESQDQRITVLNAIGMSPLPSCVLAALEYALSDQLRSLESFTIIQSCSNNPRGRHVTWAFVKSHWEALEHRFKETFFFPRLIQTVCEALSSESDALDIQLFFASRPDASTHRTVAQAIETVKIKTAWLSRDREDVKTFLLSKMTMREQ
eukprot:c10276_g3_i1.p1 GENE.c10276_g3_i1~~c10276_g3_i1.p1  ORF type:complete len:512 (-),score=112.16 c10276_g3_i1:140-1675(-)